MDSSAIEAALARLSQSLQGVAESRDRLGNEVERSLSAALTLIQSLDQIMRRQVDNPASCSAVQWLAASGPMSTRGDPVSDVRAVPLQTSSSRTSAISVGP